MTRTTGRTLALLGYLQTHREWSGAELCRRLEVSPRTLRRDVDDLRELGYVIDSSRGIGGGYRLGAGSSVPPLLLDHEEAAAIAVGLRGAALSAVNGIEDAAARALVKLEQTLPSAVRHRVRDLERAIVPLAGAPSVDVDALLAVAAAIRDARRLRIDYTRHDGAEVRREIEPHRIVRTQDRWYVIAWDPERAAWRTLRLDRMRPREPLGTRFTAREIPKDELLERTTRSIATAPYPHHVEVVVRAEVDAVRAKFGPTVAEVRDLGDGTTLLRSGSVDLDEAAMYLGMSGFAFTVRSPAALRERLVVVAQRLREAAGPA
ncbi:Helix-turn-helix type 11 domain protein [Beutenbergia cavernae DSM 12333]|uniref:Helix-turn-helix type 11 domain protein n=1 Tax=Beutenbergia cavernae (strain ATCC BAA-8 / DSM 12333 / CCUG 43141 / JCM 11478 / NBRC 16432 / NCIMB 13614 / HKI 0122) TaxID=471853 RepID=C5BVN1_BEUC1|nr:YafY family protein [Beutenbergia cavernae]ACQ78471.1 Helix-turn-helix type 11 domain protein [Beutenbergia cavernae DSM 12333]